MATGILGQANPAIATNTTVYTVPTAKTATFNINVVNTGTSGATVNVALCAASTPAASEYIEFQTVLPPGGVLERGGMVAQAGKLLVVNCSTASCSVTAYGYES
jgi:hypothetical protein